MQKTTIFLTVLLTLFVLSCSTPRNWEQKGDQAVKNYDFPRATRCYEQLVRRNSDPAFQVKYAAALGAMGKHREAAEAYRLAISNGLNDVEAKMAYARILHRLGEYDNASRWYLQYAEAGDFPDEAKSLAQECLAAGNSKDAAGGFDLKPWSQNTPASEIGAVRFENGYLVTSNRKRGFLIRVVDPQTHHNCYDVYQVKEGTNERKCSSLVPGKINSRFHDGPVAISKGNEMLLITRSDFQKGRAKKDTIVYSGLRVMSAQKKNGKWSQLQPLPFNGAEFSCAHAALSEDGSQLYFSSDMPGGYGGMDIYRSELKNGKWSQPENLGSSINTTGDEVFPFLRDEGSLYFASNGRPGLGGLDLFVAFRKEAGWADAQNLGRPINSPADDFAMVWNWNQGNGQLSSNREGGAGQDDIYMFSERITVETIAMDAISGAVIPGAKVVVLGSNGERKAYETDAQGRTSFYSNSTRDYKIVVEADMYEPGDWFAQAKEAGLDAKVSKVLKLNAVPGINGDVMDESGRPLQPVNVDIYKNGELNASKKVLSPKFTIPVELGHRYDVVISTPGFVPKVVQITTGNAQRQYPVSVHMKRGSGKIVKGRVLNAASGTPLENAHLSVISQANQKHLDSTTTDSEGRFLITAPSEGTVKVIASKARFATFQEEFVPGVNNLKPLEIGLLPNDVGKIVKTIFFDFGSASIPTQYNNQLLEIVQIMQDNPLVHLEIGAHTDNLGSAEANQALSESRANASASFLIAHGISASRISPVGYGETRPLVPCPDIEACSDQQHALNRRSEFKIIKIENGL
jgi:outer membrane protein OmpA-like peptidoglycan-associated protein